MEKRTTYLPADVDAELEREAAAQSRPVAQVIRMAVELYLRDHP